MAERILTDNDRNVPSIIGEQSGIDDPMANKNFEDETGSEDDKTPPEETSKGTYGTNKLALVASEGWEHTVQPMKTKVVEAVYEKILSAARSAVREEFGGDDQVLM